MPLIRRAVALAGALALTAPAAAGAAPERASAADEACPVPALSSPLAALGDDRSYVLAPGGSFEAGEEAWTLTGDAAVVEGNEPWQVAGSTGSRSLRLPAGASATSPAFCVDSAWPTFRLFARGRGAGKLDVDVLPADDVKVQPQLGGKVKDVKAGGWALSGDLRLFAPKPKAGDLRRVVVRISAPKRGSWNVDDVLVDPRRR